MAKVGRPSKYENVCLKTVTKLCLLGLTDEELAEYFEVNIDTIYNWKNEHPEFVEAIKNGKEKADAKVAKRLYRRAMGYEHKDVELKVVSNGNGDGSRIEEVEVTKIYPPETAAAIFWLKNRQSKRWRDKQEIETKHSGSVQITDFMLPDNKRDDKNE